MSLRDCVTAKIADPKLRKKLLAIAGDEELEAEVLASLGEYKHNLNTMVHQGRLRSRHNRLMADYGEGTWRDPSKKSYDPKGYVADMVSGSGKSMEARSEAIISNLHADLDAVLRKAKADNIAGVWWGQKDESYMRKLAMAIHGDDVVESELAIFGEAFRKMNVGIAERINKAGGNINVKDDFYINHIQSSDRVYAAGREKWKADMKERIELKDMIYEGSKKSVDDVLDEAFDNIVDPAKHAAGMGKAFRRRFNFKSGKDWYEFNKLYGEEDVFGTIMKYIDSAGKNIAAMETFGPNPRKMVESLMGDATDMVKSMERKGQKTALGMQGKAALNRYDNIMGFSHPGNIKWVHRGQALRVGQTVTKLGMATISAITDTAFGTMASAMKGMPIVQTMMKQLKEVAVKGDTKFMAQIGVISDIVADEVRAAHRFADVSGNGKAIKVANAYIKAIGLSRWTNAMKVGHAHELLAHVTNMRHTNFGDLHKGMQQVMKSYGIDEGVWSHLQAAPLVHNKGATFINPVKIADENTRTAFTAFLQQEARYAVPEPNAATRAALNVGTAPGTFWGEILRTTTQFKAFPITVAQMQYARLKSLPTHSARMKYGSQLLAGTTVLGALALWAKDIANGRDMQELDAKFVFDSMVQGGATHIIGDVLREVGEYGGGVGEAAFGPSQGLFNMLAKAPKELLDDEQTLKEYAGKVTSTGLKQIGQAASYGKLLVNRMMLDGLREEVYPEIKKQRRRTERKMKKEGKGYYWKPGQKKPKRTPKLGF